MQSSSSTSDILTWMQFFTDACVPTQFINSYANKFIENRIRFDMLGDLEKSHLNDMGIQAIGDCLCILKHAKAVFNKIEECRKEYSIKAEVTNEIVQVASQNTSPNQTVNVKKRCEVAKRIIGTYLLDRESKEKHSPPLPSSTASSHLSQDLISRLNFTSSSLSTKFDNDVSLPLPSTKPLVTSTTNDDELNENNKNKKIVSLKRKLNDTPGEALEYRGLLKQDYVKPRLTVTSANSTNEATEKESVFKRIKSVPTINTQNKTIPVDLTIKKTILNKPFNNGIEPLKKIRLATTEPETKPKIIPITFDKPTKISLKPTIVTNSTLKPFKSDLKPTQKSVLDRLSFS